MGTQNTQEKKGHKKIWIILILLLLCSVLLIGGYKIISSQTAKPNGNQTPMAVGVVLDSNAKVYTGVLPANKSGNQAGIKIPGYSSI